MQQHQAEPQGSWQQLSLFSLGRKTQGVQSPLSRWEQATIIFSIFVFPTSQPERKFYFEPNCKIISSCHSEVVTTTSGKKKSKKRYCLLSIPAIPSVPSSFNSLPLSWATYACRQVTGPERKIQAEVKKKTQCFMMSDKLNKEWLRHVHQRNLSGNTQYCKKGIMKPGVVWEQLCSEQLTRPHKFDLEPLLWLLLRNRGILKEL